MEPRQYGHQWVKNIWPYYRGRLTFHDLKYTVHPFVFLEQLFPLKNNRNEDIAYIIEKTTLNFPSVNKTVLKFGYKTVTSLLFAYCSVKTVHGTKLSFG